MKNLTRLNDILAREAIIYIEIEQLEAQKTGAIIDRDGQLIDSITHEQEELVSLVSLIDEERQRIVRDLASMAGLPGDSPLSSILDDESPLTDQIKDNARSLRRSIERLCSIQSGNTRLIDDNLEFFRLVVGGIKNVTDNGYGSDGTIEKNIRPSAFLNITV